MSDESGYARAAASRLPGVAYVGYREYSPARLVRREVPHRAFTLILSFGDSIDVDGRAHTSFVAGLHDRPVLTGFTGDQYGVELLVPPPLAYRLFGGLPLRELTNVCVPADDLLGRDLTARLAEAPGWAARFDLLDDALGAAAATGPAPSPEVDWAWRRLVDSGGRVRVADLADEVGWSRRHLGGRFAEQIGLTPKTAARVLRFERAAAMLRTATAADVAARCGYADQPHLQREFRDLAGVTPGQFTFVQDAQVPAALASGA